MLPAEVYFNVAVSGVLTGLVYGLMALGLSVIFGVVRVVNFAHGEMMTIAMYIAVVLFTGLGLDPLVMLVPIAAILFALGYVMQAGLINRFVTRSESTQFLLMIAVAIIMVNVLLIVFGPDARGVSTPYSYDSFEVGPLIIDATKAYAAATSIVVAVALYAFFRFTRTGTAIRACADNHTGALVVGLDVKHLYALTFGLGAACVGAAGTMMVLLVDVTPALGPAYTLLAFTIVITGGSRGIGAASARLAGARGWSVAINYVGNAAAAEATRAAVEEAGGKAIAVKGDVANEQDVIALFDATTEAFGPIDGLVNNAGILMAPPQQLAEMSIDRIRRVMDVNVIGAMVVAREAVRRMTGEGGRGGSIVNVSSVASRLGGPFENTDYAASKGAIDTLTIGLSKELGPLGIRVNAVRPGLIETDIHASGGQPGRLERLVKTVPMGRSASADEVGESIVWLLSDAASYINGALLDVAGGR